MGKKRETIQFPTRGVHLFRSLTGSRTTFAARQHFDINIWREQRQQQFCDIHRDEQGEEIGRLRNGLFSSRPPLFFRDRSRIGGVEQSMATRENFIDTAGDEIGEKHRKLEGADGQNHNKQRHGCWSRRASRNQ